MNHQSMHSMHRTDYCRSMQIILLWGGYWTGRPMEDLLSLSISLSLTMTGDYDRRTPLHLACASGNHGAVEAFDLWLWKHTAPSSVDIRRHPFSSRKSLGNHLEITWKSLGNHLLLCAILVVHSRARCFCKRMWSTWTVRISAVWICRSFEHQSIRISFSKGRWSAILPGSIWF